MSDNLDTFATGIVSHSLKIFEGCNHFLASIDLHDMCSSYCVHWERQKCHRYNNCLFCAEWDEVTWITWFRVPTQSQSPAPWDIDNGSPPRKWPSKDSSRDSRSWSPDPDDPSRSDRDPCGSGRRDGRHHSPIGAGSSQNRSSSCQGRHRNPAGPLSSRERATTVSLGTGLPWTPVLLGLDSPGTGLPWTRTTLLGHASLPALEPVGSWHFTELHIKMDCRGGEDSISIEWWGTPREGHCAWIESFIFFMGLWLSHSPRGCVVCSILAFIRGFSMELPQRSRTYSWGDGDTRAYQHICEC